MTLRETAHIGCGIAAKSLCMAQNVVPQGVPAKKQVLKLIVNQFGRTVVVGGYLVAHHLNLLVELLLRIGGMENDVGEQIYRHGEMVFQYGGIIHGVLLGGEGVEVAAVTLKTVEHLQGTAAHGALERDMLAEMGQSFLARHLVTGAGANAIATIYHRRRRGVMDEAQTAGQCMCVISHDVDCFTELVLF